jgi:4'-phosphopantetheinyl transferase
MVGKGLMVDGSWRGGDRPPIRKAPGREKTVQIDIWYADLDTTVVSSREESLQGWSPAEVEVLNRLVFERDRKRYRARHHLLRNLLRRYTAPGETITIHYERGGKPILAGAYGQRGVNFSMSRSANVAAYAFARGCRLGVDIEECREFPDMTGVVDDHFTEHEKAQLNAVHRGRRTRLFFQLWTRKEALLKADGIGLLQPLNQVNVLSDVAAKGYAGQVRSGPLSRSGAYTVLDLEAPHGFVASLAYANTPAETLIRYRSVPVRHQAAGRARRGQKTHANA